MSDRYISSRLEKSSCYNQDCCEMDPNCLLFMDCLDVEIEAELSGPSDPSCELGDCDA
jgi:hypothetical protein